MMKLEQWLCLGSPDYGSPGLGAAFVMLGVPLATAHLLAGVCQLLYNGHCGLSVASLLFTRDKGSFK